MHGSVVGIKVSGRYRQGGRPSGVGVGFHCKAVKGLIILAGVLMDGDCGLGISDVDIHDPNP